MQKIAEIKDLIAQVPERVRLWCQVGRRCFFLGRFGPFGSAHPCCGWEGFKHRKVEVALELRIAWCFCVCISSLLFLYVHQRPVAFVCVLGACCFCVCQLPVVFVCVPAPCCLGMCTSSLLFLCVCSISLLFLCVPAPCCFCICTSSLLCISHFAFCSWFPFSQCRAPPPPSPSHFVSPWEFLQYCGTLKQGGRWFICKVWPLGWCCTTVCLQGGSDHRAKGQRRRTARCEVIQW